MTGRFVLCRKRKVVLYHDRMVVLCYDRTVVLCIVTGRLLCVATGWYIVYCNKTAFMRQDRAVVVYHDFKAFVFRGILRTSLGDIHHLS